MNSQETIFDRYGRPSVVLLDDGGFMTIGGERLGFIENGGVYDYNANIKGWYTEGVLRDRSGNLVGFGENPRDYHLPVLPITAIPPIPAVPPIEPIRPIVSPFNFPPQKTYWWSDHTPYSLLVIGGHGG